MFYNRRYRHVVYTARREHDIKAFSSTHVLKIMPFYAPTSSSTAIHYDVQLPWVILLIEDASVPNAAASAIQA